jgi:hypothetical protein
MEREFPDLVYQGFGQHQRKGGSFGYTEARDQAHFDELLKAGWFATQAEAIEAHDNRHKRTSTDKPVSDKPLTRAELEELARAKGVTVDARWSDATLQSKLV